MMKQIYLAITACVVATLFQSAPARCQTPQWQGSLFPSYRYAHAMAYDSYRGQTVLFGGASSGGYATPGNETWEWNDSAAILRSRVGPSTRYYHAITYDSLRHVTVLFGGSTSSGASGETWEWDGNVWALRSNTGPSPRWSHSLTYDANRGVTVLFGGYNNSVYLGDTWEWDGFAWTLKSTSGPAPRYQHSLAFDSSRNLTVLYGGYSYINGTRTYPKTFSSFERMNKHYAETHG